MSRIAFYATIKPPDHHIASGDRLVARNLITALELAGHEVKLASRFIAYSKRENDEILAQRKSEALQEANRIVCELADNPPDLWLTYHPYCKAPDWIGPFVSKALNIPYVTVEAAKTGQGFENGGDRWAKWRAEAQQGIVQANLHIALKPTDISYLNDLLGDNKSITLIKPFMDTKLPSPLLPVELPEHWRPNWPTLITVGMMRPGKKVINYELLADALRPLQSLHWNLIIVGDGPERPAVETHFGEFDQSRLHFCGAIPHNEVLALMKKSDLFVWPGWKEPIGMVYLEAQLMGLPVAALDSMGVSLSVSHGRTGLLAPEDDRTKFSDNLSMLISHPALRSDFGKAAQSHILSNHSLKAASISLDQALKTVLADPSKP